MESRPEFMLHIQRDLSSRQMCYVPDSTLYLFLLIATWIHSTFLAYTFSGFGRLAADCSQNQDKLISCASPPYLPPSSICTPHRARLTHRGCLGTGSRSHGVSGDPSLPGQVPNMLLRTCGAQTGSLIYLHSSGRASALRYAANSSGNVLWVGVCVHVCMVHVCMVGVHRRQIRKRESEEGGRKITRR